MLASSARRPAPPRRRRACGRVRWGRLTGLTGAVVLALTGSGCAGKEQAAAPSPAPTPMASLNTAAMQVPRIEFCGLVPDAAVADALDGRPDGDASYGNGDEQDLPGVGTDVVHEIGCLWRTDEGSAARAWVFARPVEASFARTVVRASRRSPGCRLDRGPAFGRPTLTQVCREKGGEQRVRHAGLFGQTWLTCEVVGSEDLPALRSRAEEWCVQVANALNTAR